MTGRSWSRTGAIVAGVLLAQVGVTAEGHSQSAGSIGVRVQVASMEPARAAWAVAAEEFVLPGGARDALKDRQPGSGQPALVVIDSVSKGERSEPLDDAPTARVSIVFP